MSQQAKQSSGLQQNLDSRSLLGDSGVQPSFPVCDERQQNLEMFRQSSPHIIRVAALHIVSRLVLPANNTFSIKHQGRWHGQARQAGGAYRNIHVPQAKGICHSKVGVCQKRPLQAMFGPPFGNFLRRIGTDRNHLPTPLGKVITKFF